MSAYDLATPQQLHNKYDVRDSGLTRGRDERQRNTGAPIRP